MKFFSAIFILLSCMAFFAEAEDQVYQNDELTITRLEENMWVIETYDSTTMYLVEGSQKAMLIDTGENL